MKHSEQPKIAKHLAKVAGYRISRFPACHPTMLNVITKRYDTFLFKPFDDTDQMLRIVEGLEPEKVPGILRELADVFEEKSFNIPRFRARLCLAVAGATGYKRVMEPQEAFPAQTGPHPQGDSLERAVEL